MDFAVVNTQTSIVENVVVLAEGANWNPPEGCIVVPLVGQFGIGDTWDGSSFTRAPEPEPAPIGSQPTSSGAQTI